MAWPLKKKIGSKRAEKTTKHREIALRRENDVLVTKYMLSQL